LNISKRVRVTVRLTHFSPNNDDFFVSYVEIWRICGIIIEGTGLPADTSKT